VPELAIAHANPKKVEAVYRRSDLIELESFVKIKNNVVQLVYATT
jgi:hypothetical protein